MRRVAVLAAATDDPAARTSSGWAPTLIATLHTFAADLDALGDLQVAEAVHGMVRGRPTDVAATTSAAGLGTPTTLDVARTPRVGRSVTSVAVLVLPDTSDGGTGAGPVALADGAVAAHIDARAGDPSGPE